MNPSHVSPTVCPECGHRFPPYSVEPSWCPNCGRECTGYGEAEDTRLRIPDEMPVTPEELDRWRALFWFFFFIGPICAVLLMLFQREILASLPASLRPFADVSSHPFVPLFLSAAGAGFCMANVWFARRRFEDILAYAFLIGILVMAVYFLIGAIVDPPVN